MPRPELCAICTSYEHALCDKLCHPRRKAYDAGYADAEAEQQTQRERDLDAAREHFKEPRVLTLREVLLEILDPESKT